MTNPNTMTMVEKVARAIYEERNGAGCKPWAHLTRSHQGEYLGDARAAISAMREPTEGMIEAADKAPLPMVKLDSFSAVRTLEFKAKWNAALASALTESK